MVADWPQGKWASAALFIGFIETLNKYVHSFEKMTKPDDRENDSDGVMPEAMTVVWILVDAEDCETCYDCG